MQIYMVLKVCKPVLMVNNMNLLEYLKVTGFYSS